MGVMGNITNRLFICEKIFIFVGSFHQMGDSDRFAFEVIF